MTANSKVPHSWTIAKWPEHIYPHTPKKARYVLRSQRDSLLREKALVRIGRELVVIGDRYNRWMQKRVIDVPGYECPANKGRAQT